MASIAPSLFPQASLILLHFSDGFLAFMPPNLPEQLCFLAVQQGLHLLLQSFWADANSRHGCTNMHANP